MRAIVAFALSCLSLSVLAQSKRQLPAFSTATPPVIDGDLSDLAWKSAPKATGFVEFNSATPATDTTVVSILFDEKNLYVAFDCQDSHPDAIVARETVRDTKFQSQGNRNTEDNVQIDFDPFLTHSYNDLSSFSVNPLGTRSAAFAGGRAGKAEWNGDWEAAAKRSALGWSAEIRIPWTSLNYPSGKQKITIGINFSRYIARKKELQEWSSTGPQGFLEREGLWTDVQVPRSAFHPKLSVLPYILAGETQGGLAAKQGVDMRYTLTPQLTAVGTINPDYSNVEGAVQSIQFSHTERFVPDRRPFFVEGGDNFAAQTNYNDIGAFFYSNRVPLFDLGAKVYGKLTPKDSIGFLNTYGYDGRNDFVMRYSRNNSETSNSGVMIVRRDSPADQFDGEIHNTVALADDHTRWGKFGVEAIGANSIGTGAGGGAQVLSTTYEDKNLISVVQYSAVSNNFLVPDGFIPFTGYKGFVGVEALFYNWKHGYWNGTQFVLVPVYFMHPDGRPYNTGIQAQYQLTSRNDWFYQIDYNDNTFEELHDRTVRLNVIRGFTNRFQQFGLQVITGETGSEKTTYLGPTVKLRLFKKLDVLYSGAIQNRLGVDQQHVGTLNYELSPTRSFGGRVVSRNGAVNSYFFYRSSGGKGTEYYVLLGDPDPRRLRTARTLQVKVVFAF